MVIPPPVEGPPPPVDGPPGPPGPPAVLAPPVIETGFVGGENAASSSLVGSFPESAE